MSMIGHLRAITPSELRTLKQTPGLTKQFLHGALISNTGDVETALLQIEKLAKQKILNMAKKGTSAGSSKENEEIRERIIARLESAGVTLEGSEENGLSLEKSWHCLHYLLTGTARETNSVLGQTILGGTEIGPDLGYGPARYLEPNEVAKVAESLRTVSKEALTSRFDLEGMKAAEVYACHDQSDLDLAQEYFTQVLTFYQEAAARGDAVLLYLD